MDAGRELDALVGEKVLGWTRIYQLSGPDSLPWQGKKPGTAFLQSITKFSTSWAAMREVVEAMEQRGYGVSMGNHLGCMDKDSTWWHCSIWEYDKGYRVKESEQAPTLPHAVCLAAIAAMEKANVNADAAMGRL